MKRILTFSFLLLLLSTDSLHAMLGLRSQRNNRLLQKIGQPTSEQEEEPEVVTAEEPEVESEEAPATEAGTIPMSKIQAELKKLIQEYIKHLGAYFSPQDKNALEALIKK